MIYVENDDAIYVQWLADNKAKGFVINLVPEGRYRTGLYGGSYQAMLHRANCIHLAPPEPDKTHTFHAKVCSLDFAEITRWVQEQGVKKVADCGSCRPELARWSAMRKDTEAT
jgi:hypothetical protein